MKKTVNIIVLGLLIIQSLMYIILFPNLEHPDGSFHVRTIINNENVDESLYYYMMGGINNIVTTSFGINDISIIEENKDFELFNWGTIRVYSNFNSINIMILQLVNLFITIVSIFFYSFILKKNSKLQLNEKEMFLRISLLYYLYPAVGYLIVGVTPDFFGYIYQPFFILLVYLRKHILNIFICMFLFLFFDEGIILNLYFLIMYILYNFLFSRKYRKQNLLITLFSLSFIYAIYIFVTKILVKIPNNRIIEIMLYSQENHGVLYTKFINFFLGSFYFLGSGSFITFPFFYLIYLLVVLIIVKKICFGNSGENLNLKIMLYSSLVSIFSAILLIPPYSHIRYYLYFIIILLMCGFSVIIRDKYLVSEKKYLWVAVAFFVHNLLLILAISVYTWN